MLEAQQNLFTQVYDLWEKTYEKSQNQDKEVTSTPDKRFRGEIWEKNPYFHFAKEYYILNSKWIQDLVDVAEDLDAQDALKARFILKQLTDAASPTNFPFSNPEVIQKTIETRGKSQARV